MSEPLSVSEKKLLRSVTGGSAAAVVALLAMGQVVLAVSRPGGALTSLTWFDVFAVQVASALPLAWWIGVWSGSLRKLPRMLLAALLFIPCAVLASTAAGVPPGSAMAESIVSSLFVVLATSLCTLLSAGLAPGAVRVPIALMTFLVLAVVAFVVPGTYLEARLRNEQIVLTERLDQSRFGEALAIARPIARLEPRSMINGRRIGEVVATLEKGVGALTLQAEAPLPEKVNDELRLTRGQGLAILGRTDEALEMIAPVDEANANRWLLAGTIHENEGRWDEGVAAYEKAAALLEQQPESPSKLGRRVQAIKGIGFCERKAGRTRWAEGAYQSLLALAPSADSHFLAAQFYEDAQATKQADRHARQAMALDPARYGEAGQKLVDRLQTLHFGCWGVYARGAGVSTK
ncbi:MAG TPA: tetratricopeptide repeat protein [Caulifigura sp.]|jgi:hypothetical protein|nr:tetratricopeptide repeat protein [Caulifigura sp.]